jgi:hypothetical protein
LGLRDSDPLIAKIADGRLGGVIGREALTGPDDLVVYVGLPAEMSQEDLPSPISGFGVPVGQAANIDGVTPLQGGWLCGVISLKWTLV